MEPVRSIRSETAEHKLGSAVGPAGVACRDSELYFKLGALLIPIQRYGIGLRRVIQSLAAFRPAEGQGGRRGVRRAGDYRLDLVNLQLGYLHFLGRAGKAEGERG